jgi:hypothetical protein
VSPLFRDELRISVRQDRVQVQSWTAGWRPKMKECMEWSTTPTAAGTPSWAAPVETLRTAIAELQGLRANASVTLSNEFVNYELIPWNSGIASAEEEEAFIQHQFSQTFGAAATAWSLRVAQAGYGQARVASAVDKDCIDAIARCFAGTALRLHGIEPYLMGAFNAVRKDLPGGRTRLVIVEGAKMSIIVLEDFSWSGLRVLRVNQDWPQRLGQFLERDRLFDEAESGERAALLFSPEVTPETVFETGGWSVAHLHQGTPPQCAQTQASPLEAVSA